MKTNLTIAVAVGLLVAAGGAAAQLTEPKIKILGTMADPLEKAVLIGRVATGNMVLQLELEGSESMWMQMGNPPMWALKHPAQTSATMSSSN